MPAIFLAAALVPAALVTSLLPRQCGRLGDAPRAASAISMTEPSLSKVSFRLPPSGTQTMPQDLGLVLSESSDGRVSIEAVLKGTEASRLEGEGRLSVGDEVAMVSACVGPEMQPARHMGRSWVEKAISTRQGRSVDLIVSSWEGEPLRADDGRAAGANLPPGSLPLQAATLVQAASQAASQATSRFRRRGQYEPEPPPMHEHEHAYGEGRGEAPYGGRGEAQHEPPHAYSGRGEAPYDAYEDPYEREPPLEPNEPQRGRREMPFPFPHARQPGPFGREVPFPLAGRHGPYDRREIPFPRGRRHGPFDGREVAYPTAPHESRLDGPPPHDGPHEHGMPYQPRGPRADGRRGAAYYSGVAPWAQGPGPAEAGRMLQGHMTEGRMAGAGRMRRGVGGREAEADRPDAYVGAAEFAEALERARVAEAQAADADRIRWEAEQRAMQAEEWASQAERRIEELSQAAGYPGSPHGRAAGLGGGRRADGGRRAGMAGDGRSAGGAAGMDREA